jgi:HEXXH motif-containing protein
VTELEQACRSFASPFEAFRDDFLDTVAVAHARQVVERYLDRFGRFLHRHGAGLVEALHQWLGAQADFQDVWDLSFGRLRATLDARAPRGVIRSAAAAALRLAERGTTGDWEVRLPIPARLRIGRFVLPPSNRVRVAAERLALRIRLGHGDGAKNLTLPLPIHAGTCLEGVESLATAGAEGARLVILREQALETGELPGIRGRVASSDSVVGPLDATLRLIGRHAPRYLEWIERVTRHVLPLRDVGPNLTSSSAAWRPGVLYLTNRADPAALAEMLVHEGTHQYMYVLRLLGPFDDGSDRRRYHSPVTGRMRSLERMVLAYHAIANIVLFYRSCPAASPLRPGESERSFVRSLAAYERALVTNPALTPIGRALSEPLYERLHASDAVTASRRPGTARRGAPGSCRSTTSRLPTAR